MTLRPWSPWQDLENLQHQLSDIFGDVSLPVMDAREGQWMPRVDVRETDEALLVQAELPGVDKKDVTLEVKDGVLTLSGERRYEKDVKEEHVHRVERMYGHFSRSFNLPRNVDAAKVDAHMKDGVLQVRLPKLESAKPKAIAIH